MKNIDSGRVLEEGCGGNFAEIGHAQKSAQDGRTQAAYTTEAVKSDGCWADANPPNRQTAQRVTRK
jgi:hypothetical protein